MLPQRILISLLTEIFFHPYELAIFLSQMESSWRREQNSGGDMHAQKSVFQYWEQINATKTFFGFYKGFQYKLMKIFITEYITGGIWKLCSGN